MTRRLLQPGDEARLEAFLRKHPDTSMFLRSNSARAGLADRGEKFCATYIAAFDGDEIVAVAAHNWNGMISVQGAFECLPDIVRDAVARTGRTIKGFTGPYAQVLVARDAVAPDRVATLDACEDLFAMSLDELRVPAIAAGCRRPDPSERPTLARWWFEYGTETMNLPATEERAAQIARDFEIGPSLRVLELDGELVAMTSFNAETADTVQVGGVFTPAAHRRRGYARAVVAGSLAEARDRGIARSILFTRQTNVAARTAYLSIGYRIVGDFGLILYDD